MAFGTKTRHRNCPAPYSASSFTARQYPPPVDPLKSAIRGIRFVLLPPSGWLDTHNQTRITIVPDRISKKKNKPCTLKPKRNTPPRSCFQELRIPGPK